MMHQTRYTNNKPIKLDGPEFKKWRDEILLKERAILQTLGFNFQIEHPYANMLAKVKNLQYGLCTFFLNTFVYSSDAFSFIDNQKRLAQLAWNFINDRFVIEILHQVNSF